MNDYIGTIKLFAGSNIPNGWLLCNGASYSSTAGQSYFALFAVIGTAYGGASGTYNIPDLRGRIPVGTGLSTVSGTTYNTGETGGVESNTIGMNNMPSHTHNVSGSISMQASTDPASTDNPTNAYFATAAQDTYAADTSGADLGISYDFGLTSQTSGNGEPYDSRQPFVAMNYIICYQGIFPSRMSEMEDYIGTVLPFTGPYVPPGWLLCDGKSYSIGQYQALYALITTRYGGSGTNFCVPNLMGVAPIGAVNATTAPGTPQGTEHVTLNVSNILNHTHTVNDTIRIQCSALPAATSEPTDNFPAVTSGVAVYGTSADVSMAPFTYNPHVTSSGSSTAAAMENRTPYLAVQYIICAEGWFVGPPQPAGN